MPDSVSMSSSHIVIAASMADSPLQAGWTWAVLQYLLGFKQLGHRVTFLDPIVRGAIRPAGAPLQGSETAAWFLDIVRKYGLHDASALLLADGAHDTVGLSYDTITKLVRGADMLINVSGRLRDERLLTAARTAVYLDVDPAFTQLWQAVQHVDMGFAGHSHFVSVGHVNQNALVPSAGKRWIFTRPPVVLSHWPVATAVTCNALTTVANWRGYGSIEYRGLRFGQKAHTLRELISLPQRTSERFVLALGIDRGEERDVRLLAQHGWHLVDPLAVAGTPEGYRSFVQGSKAEFGVAKSGYVLSQCGWFSDRSVCYLASGRPVIAHDTGFNGDIPAGEGLFRFSTEDDVIRAIDAMNTDYIRHCRAARQIAEAHFDARLVLDSLLSRIGA